MADTSSFQKQIHNCVILKNIIEISLTRLIFPLLLTALVSCNSDYTPRPRGYFKISFPAHEYQEFNKAGYPYTFEYPKYAEVIQDTSFFEAKPENPYWINIDIPRFHARLYISYKEVNKDFDKLKEDAYKMTMKHSLKATSIEDSTMKTPMGLSGIFFNVGGNAATASQFYLTDSVKHFLRGALYFDSTPNEDSLKIVNNFLVEDMRHLINTLKWKN
jgi:gliding motility-associated lipoprotein GldD